MSGFKPYPAYKDSGVDWLGEVPEEWTCLKLKRIASLQSGYAITSKSIEVDGDYPVFGGNGLRGFTDTFTHEGEYTLIGRQGALCGNINYGIGRFFASEHAIVVSPRHGIITKWIGEILRIMNLNQYSISAAQPGLAVERIIELCIPLPSTQEQTQIARFLDHETTRIDALIEEQQRLIALLQEKRHAVISHAVTKGLDPTVPMKDSGAEWLGEVPAHWVVGSLRYYATIQGGIAKGKDYEGRQTIKVPYLRVANVQNGYIDLTEVKEISVLKSEVSRYNLRRGDVLMNEGGDNDKLGRGAVWQGQIDPCLHQNHVFAIRPNNLLAEEWLATFTQSIQARAYFFLHSKQSTNLASISSSNVMSLTIPIPSISEQQSILKHLNDVQTHHEHLLNVATETIELLTERRSALISAAVTGKIDVRDWQPPAPSKTHDVEEAEAV